MKTTVCGWRENKRGNGLEVPCNYLLKGIYILEVQYPLLSINLILTYHEYQFLVHTSTITLFILTPILSQIRWAPYVF